jgi:hypothetical protein
LILGLQLLPVVSLFFLALLQQILKMRQFFLRCEDLRFECRDVFDLMIISSLLLNGVVTGE